jgi:hypothetical protein
MPPFIRGRRYTRDAIHAAVGGSKEEFLPHVDCRVVCGCFDPAKNPLAPAIVLPGNTSGRMRWARVFAEQSVAVPCFLKRATHAWEYVGDYRVARQSFDGAEITQHRARTGRAEISSVLHLKAAG